MIYTFELHLNHSKWQEYEYLRIYVHVNVALGYRAYRRFGITLKPKENVELSASAGGSGIPLNMTSV